MAKKIATKKTTTTTKRTIATKKASPKRTTAIKKVATRIKSVKTTSGVTKSSLKGTSWRLKHPTCYWSCNFFDSNTLLFMRHGNDGKLQTSCRYGYKMSGNNVT